MHFIRTERVTEFYTEYLPALESRSVGSVVVSDGAGDIGAAVQTAGEDSEKRGFAAA